MKLSLSNFPLEFFYDIDTQQLEMLEAIRECGYTCTDYNVRMEYLDERLEERAQQLKELLEKCGIEFECIPMDIDESLSEGNTLEEKIMILSEKKAVNIPWESFTYTSFN